MGHPFLRVRLWQVSMEKEGRSEGHRSEPAEAAEFPDSGERRPKELRDEEARDPADAHRCTTGGTLLRRREKLQGDEHRQRTPATKQVRYDSSEALP